MLPSQWQVGTNVLRCLDDVWFPAVIIKKNSNKTFDISYIDEGNHEEYVNADELRFRLEKDNPKRKEDNDIDSLENRKSLDDSLLLNNSPIYDNIKEPRVTLHNRGDVASSTGYIINGLENNIAAGNGLRGIRWLRDNNIDV